MSSDSLSGMKYLPVGMTRADGARYPSVGRCIYCGCMDTKRFPEHIIPFAITADALIFEDASCAQCAQEINKFEQPVLRRMLGPFRVVANSPTRNPRQRPKNFKLKIGKADDRGQLIEPPHTIIVPATEMHLVLLGWRLPPPGILYEEEPPRDQIRGEPWCRLDEEPVNRHIQRFRDTTGWQGNIAFKAGDVPHFAYLRWLAKIAHGFAIAELGYEAFEHFLPAIILGRSNHYCHYIGGELTVPAPGETDAIFNIRHGRLVGDENTYIAVELHLFPFYGSPIHQVIVGVRKRTADEIALRQEPRNDV
jgi:hypothetical protein